MFLQSKDDHLLLQIAGLIHAIIMCNPNFKENIAVIFGGLVINDPKSFTKIKT